MVGLSRFSTFLDHSEYESNGAQIYYTSTSKQGTYIGYRGGPASGGMMMGRMTCAACHGSDGRGGVHWMHMQQMDAPDIRWITLSGEAHGVHDDHDEEMEDIAYDEEVFKNAVLRGLAHEGQLLSSTMPRWEMNEADLEDLISFLKNLP
jgi:mono/diheme cytochrome c family protein